MKIIFDKDKEFYRKFKPKLVNLYSGHKLENNYETLFEHLDKTVNFFIKYFDERNLYIILKEIKKNFPTISENKIQRDILRLVFLHDIGKINYLAQEYYLGKRKKGQGNTRHAEFSLLISMIFFWNDIKPIKTDSNKNCSDVKNYALFIICTIFSYNLHHTSLYNLNNLKFIEEKIREIIKKIKEIDFEIMSDILNNFGIDFDLNKFEELFLKKRDFNEKYRESLFFYIKFFYSILVQSDYYSTYSFQFNKKIDEIKINQIDNAFIKKIESNFYNVEFNKSVKDFNPSEIKNPNNCESLNELRHNLVIQASNTLNQEMRKNKKIFMLNVPTGGGKTNISLKLAIDILKSDKNVNRVNWVFPFVNIIEQNYNVIKKTYLNNKDLSKDISQIYYDSISLDHKEYVDYENNFKKLIEDGLNIAYLNNPINVISNVNFFNSLFKVKKANRYKFANFANSVVIIDEIQSLKSEYINIFYKILKNISDNFNIYFIIMSATLPNLNEYNDKEIASSLITNYESYFKHSIFIRNKLIFKEIKFNKESFIEYFKNKIFVDYKNKKKFLIVLNTIKSSTELFEILHNDPELKEYNLFLLNSFIKKDCRENIIEFIKNNNDKIILISTQTIEAGVDLDFDIGFRDKAILDSIEQVSGRINRECKKQDAVLHIINYENESNIYKNDLRYKLLEDISFEEQKKLLNTKNFSKYYRLLFDKMKKNFDNAIDFDYFEEINKLNYQKIHKMNIIENRPELKLVFEKIDCKLFDDELISFLKTTNCKSIFDIMELKKDKKGFKYKPYIELINKLIDKNSLNIPFFNDSEKEKFKEFLKNNNYIVKDFKNFIIIKHKFNEDFYEEYKIKNMIFKYFNYYKLKQQVKDGYDFAYIIS